MGAVEVETGFPDDMVECVRSLDSISEKSARSLTFDCATAKIIGPKRPKTLTIPSDARDYNTRSRPLVDAADKPASTRFVNPIALRLSRHSTYM